MNNPPFGFNPPDPGDDREGGSEPSFSMSDLGAMLSQFGAMMQGMGRASESGPVNWTAAEDVARAAIASSGDRSVSAAQRREVEQAVRLAELWLDPLTTFPTSAGTSKAWSRAEWLQATLPAWQEVITPIAEQVQNSLGSMIPDGADLAASLPEELRSLLPPNINDLAALLSPLVDMAKQMGSGMFAMQAGQGLAALAGEVLGSGDVGLPLTAEAIPTLLPENVARFGDGLGVEQSEVMLYAALREAAQQRLFEHVQWLGPTVRAAVTAYARGIGVDSDAMQEALSGIDISNPAAIQDALSSGVLAPEDSPQQKAALARLETLLALTEGWVDHVVNSAASGRLNGASRLQEAVRRRRAVGGPAEKTFSTLVGLEMRPRRLREAAVLWAEVERTRGVEGRDALWAHPDLLPGPEDLDHPEQFLLGTGISDADLAALTAAPAESAREAGGEPQEPDGAEPHAGDSAELPSQGGTGEQDQPTQDGPGA